ncbi:hypothetical protein FTO70_02120 [Methanosarcina sp. KYL-1]|uniref:hypothetical protein n=1 Tax=Methanosarcina sp. KYL-1 TaxID=2602068 RepID=UPI0021012966|nr:hypothetical protein [Methanosarcina sp. KYL-1]MCQ1534511.1 hypothetical protein [Methanosarcina sp. KYL-1]
MKEEIERIIDSDRKLGFVSVQEFVKDAIRRNIIQYSSISCEKRNSASNGNENKVKVKGEAN